MTPGPPAGAPSPGPSADRSAPAAATGVRPVPPMSGSIASVGTQGDPAGHDVPAVEVTGQRGSEADQHGTDEAGRPEWLRSTWSRVGASNATAALYGAVVSAGLLSVADEDATPMLELLLGTAGILAVFWLAHSYTHVLGTRPVDAQGSLMGHMWQTMKHEFPLVLGGLPALVLVGVCVALGVHPETAVGAAILITGVVLTIGGFVYGRRCGARGWDLARETITGAFLGAVVLALEIFAH